MDDVISGIFIVLFCLGLILYIFYKVKDKIWDEPHEEIKTLKEEIKNINERNSQTSKTYENNIELILYENKKTIYAMQKEIDPNISKKISDLILLNEWKIAIDIFYPKKSYGLFDLKHMNDTIKKSMEERIISAIDAQYKFEYLLLLLPELKTYALDEQSKIENFTITNADIKERVNVLQEIVSISKTSRIIKDSLKEFILLKNRIAFLESANSNLTAIPYMAKIMADYTTFNIEKLAINLDWGSSVVRLNKVKAIREIRKDAEALIERYKEAEYQLAYLKQLYPVIEDIIETEFNELPNESITEMPERDPVRNYITKEEWGKLSETERNQLALDRYIESHSKTKWQIGRDYELYIGYKYIQKGYDIDYYGSYMGLEDLGRDLIAKKNGNTLIIQCKYWGSQKLIREKHIAQLYGTVASYCMENNLKSDSVMGVFITNIELSNVAKKFAQYLGIETQEKFKINAYPRIKCNIGRDEFGSESKIYHLPFDQQYDNTKIIKSGESFAMTVVEAERKGFRRAHRWFGE